MVPRFHPTLIVHLRSVQFADAFEKVGLEMVSDLCDADDVSVKELEDALKDAGAKVCALLFRCWSSVLYPPSQRDRSQCVPPPSASTLCAATPRRQKPNT